MYRPRVEGYRPTYDSTKDRIGGILREHGLLSSSGYVNQTYEIGRAENINFADEAAIIRLAKYGCKACRDKNQKCNHTVPEDESLWADVFFSFEDYDTPASRSSILKGTQPPITAERLADTFRDLYSSHPEQLMLTPQARAQREDQADRERMVRELTSAGSFTVTRPDGQKVRFDVDGRPIEFSSSGMTPAAGRGRASDPGFAGMTTEQIRELHKTVLEQRRLQSLTPQELRREINPARQKIFEASTASARPSPNGLQLVNPDNGQPITTKRDLIRFVNADRDNTKRLIQRNGRTDPTLARVFEQILNGAN